jgi:hypothetical protein
MEGASLLTGRLTAAKSRVSADDVAAGLRRNRASGWLHERHYEAATTDHCLASPS